ncbi:DUF2336 domain-containing protein [Candidatus Bealeia paramacronuclearis]|uniref:DUF2336 domain-containing protein n=1 Tax=Candidatus Bealeia paramacronuclearis TaxID=1921001 RepID=A0ABZ2C5H0_9PROT|nr:hypothetical protein [Candidatus Bealeia paramacronuclearis]
MRQNPTLQNQIHSYERAKKIAHSGTREERTEIAGQLETPPEILYFLAQDPETSVRLNVAQNSVTPIQADEILSKDPDTTVREKVAEKLFKETSDLSFLNDPRKKEAANHIIENFAHDPSSKIRRLLARAVKMLSELSHKLALLLAQDPDADVSVPLLKYSPVLKSQDLKNMVRHSKNAPHITPAIAQRHEIEEIVCDEIVHQEDELAVSMLLSNIGAKLSQDAYDVITDKVQTHPDWQEPLAARGGLPETTIKRLALVISGTLLKTLVSRNHIAPSAMNDVLGVIKERVLSGEIENEIFDALQLTPQDPLSPYERAKYDYLEGSLTEEFIESALLKGEQAYVTGAIAIMARAPYEAVQKAITMQHAKALMSFIWRGGLSARLGLEVQKRMAKMTGQKVLYPRNGTEFPLTEREMLWQLELFTDLAG